MVVSVLMFDCTTSCNVCDIAYLADYRQPSWLPIIKELLFGKITDIVILGMDF
jgi:hypothetical protein